MLRLSPHLTFNGDCKAAFQTYRRILGGELTTLMSYGESPMAAQVDPRWHDRIVHATLLLADVELLGADLLPEDYRAPQGFFVTLTVEGPGRGKSIFESLADGGQVQLPFASTFWSPGFGVLVDRYKVPWEINSAASAPPPDNSIEQP